METLLERWNEIVPFVAAALVALGVLAWRGCLRQSALADAPVRLHFTVADVGIGLILMLLGMMLYVPVLQWLGLPLPGRESLLKEVAQLPFIGQIVTVDYPSAKALAFRPIVGQLCSQLPVVLFVLYRAIEERDGIARLGIKPRHPSNEIITGFLALLAALPIVLGANSLGIAIGLLAGEETPAIGHDLLQQLVDNPEPIAGSLLIVSAVILAPVFEEFIFRGLLQTFFVSLIGPRARWLAIVATSALFAVIHLGSVPWQVLPGLFALSMMFGWLYEKHGSLLPCIVLHGMFNAANVVMGLMMTGE